MRVTNERNKRITPADRRRTPVVTMLTRRTEEEGFRTKRVYAGPQALDSARADYIEATIGRQVGDPILVTLMPAEAMPGWSILEHGRMEILEDHYS